MPPNGGRTLPRLALDLLTDLERREAELLSWGIVDGAFTLDELLDLVTERLVAGLDAEPPDVPYANAAAVIAVLKEQGLIFEFERIGRDGRFFRTRTAEAVRLFFRLKQLFPKHAKPDGWRAGRDLIADYRLILRPRRYPKRDIKAAAVLVRLAAVGAGDGLSRRVVGALLGVGGRPLDLADFQVRAAERVLRELALPPRRAGTIVCAGTGSGKTLAFYLPALLMLARFSAPERWTRCLAIYPRNELLKDQLSSALRQTRLLNQALRAEGRSAVTVGALYGEVPRSSRDVEGLQRRWTKVGDDDTGGWVCPYISCPEATCEGGRLIWGEVDRRAGTERLRCQGPGCGFILEGTEFLLTRDSMRARPPDLLFSNIETINQNMSSVSTRPLLGIGLRRADQRPRMVLLDEAHTYSGTYGAQAALLVRRWKRASLATPHFVGLSATLEDSRRFFGDLVGEPESRIEEITPADSDLEEDGQEVMLALRGDPVSKTSLLSASIQSAMLLRRVLDPRGTAASLYGSKVFAFTDDLDVTNRLFDNLLDAEGWTRRGRQVVPRRDPPLAALRRRGSTTRTTRFEAGQSWDLAHQLGHELPDSPSVRVGRTSSQDSGVDPEAETIVATASLEVGFDDPDVGGVLQHKAPRDAASFLQRKGRAGRQRGTRPWTVVLLSDFGRDRVAYQGYEQLFSPQLRPRFLPFRNRYVLRIQAVFALLDWLAERLCTRHGDTKAYLWPTLSAPPADDNYRGFNEARLGHIIEELEEVLAARSGATDLAKYLEQALAVGSEVVEQLLWTAPRSLMLSVLPTMLRRLRRRWRAASAPGEPVRVEPSMFWAPLPEFVPAALFNDLNLPEVDVCLPPYGPLNVERMPVLQALRAFAPGKVSRRFGVAHSEVSHWLPVSDDGICIVDDFCPAQDADELGFFALQVDGARRSLPCLRPRRFGVSVPPRDVGATSNARMIWASQILPRVPIALAELPSGSTWRALVRSLGFFAHGYGNAVEVRRFTRGSNYDIQHPGGDRQSGTVLFARRTSGGPEPVALGYALDADAMRLEVLLPGNLHHRVRSDPTLVRALRTARFAHEVRSTPVLDEIVSSFDRVWLVQICLSALTLEATRSNASLHRAVGVVFDERAGIPFEEVLDVIFQSGAEGDDLPDDRREELRQLLRTAAVQDALLAAVPLLSAEPDPSWEPWLGERLLTTLGAAILDACQQLCPEVDAGDLCLDIDPGPRGPEDGCEPRELAEVWLTETSPGGSGVLEAVAKAYNLDPRRFFRLVESALAPSDFEEIDTELSTLMRWLNPGTQAHRPEIIAAVAAARQANAHRETVVAQDELRTQLARAGLATTHPVLVAMQARVLRPGSRPETDQVLASMIEHWEVLEARLGVEVDARIVAYTLAEGVELDHALAHLSVAPTGDLRAWRYGTLYGLLWPRGADVRSHALPAQNPFVDLPATDRWLALSALPASTAEIRIEDADWHRRLSVALVNDGAAVLSAPPGLRRELRKAIQQALAEPLDTDRLLVQPALVGMTQEAGRLRARFDVRESVQ